MTPEDQIDHGGHHPPPQPNNGSPAPLLADARATIYLDGLIYAAYNEDRKVLESAILTHAPNHQLDIEVRLRGNEEKIWPKQDSDWNPDHAAVDAAGPFWLYVDSGNGINEEEFNAELHNGQSERSFDSVFDFPGHHGKPLPLKEGMFAVFNFPHGMSYSADTRQAELKRIPANGTVANAKDEGEIPVSNLAGIDITAATNGAGKKSIVLASKDKVFFSLELEADKQYEIKILNQPSPNATPGGHEDHFLQFYKLFDVDPRTLQRFLVVDPEHQHAPPVADDEEPPAGDPTADNPPCAPGRGSSTGGLSGGGGG